MRPTKLGCGSFASLQLEDFSKGPITASSARQVKTVIDTAKQNGVVINRTALATAGNKLLQTADTDPTAWIVAADVLEYASFLNRDVAPSTFGQQPYNVHFTRSDSTIPNWVGKLGFIGFATAPNVANFNEINSPALHTLDARGPALIVLNGGTVDMDGMFIKNVVILNAHVIYRGGPIHVDKVYFVNCTFDFDPTKTKFIDVCERRSR
jgi:hypothetical protein